MDSKKKRLNNPEERRKRIHSALVEFGQVHQLMDTSSGSEKPQDDVDALIKNMVGDKVNKFLLLIFYDFHFFQSKITAQIVNSLVTQQQDTLRGIIEDFEEKVPKEDLKTPC